MESNVILSVTVFGCFHRIEVLKKIEIEIVIARFEIVSRLNGIMHACKKFCLHCSNDHKIQIIPIAMENE